MPGARKRDEKVSTSLASPPRSQEAARKSPHVPQHRPAFARDEELEPSVGQSAAPNGLELHAGPGLDTGALRIDNTSGGTITVDDVSVVLNGGAGPTFDLWGSNVLLAGQKLVLDQTAFYNFDTSDYGYTGCGGALDPSKAPVVTVTVGGVPTTYIDSGQVLNTNGFDYACLGNESFAWRLIGTSGTTGGTPEPGSVALLIGAGVSGVGLLLRRRRKN